MKKLLVTATMAFFTLSSISGYAEENKNDGSRTIKIDCDVGCQKKLGITAPPKFCYFVSYRLNRHSSEGHKILEYSKRMASVSGVKQMEIDLKKKFRKEKQSVVNLTGFQEVDCH